MHADGGRRLKTDTRKITYDNYSVISMFVVGTLSQTRTHLLSRM